jgi:hypothetical protein
MPSSCLKISKLKELIISFIYSSPFEPRSAVGACIWVFNGCESAKAGSGDQIYFLIISGNFPYAQISALKA